MPEVNVQWEMATVSSLGCPKGVSGAWQMATNHGPGLEKVLSPICPGAMLRPNNRRERCVESQRGRKIEVPGRGQDRRWRWSVGVR